MTLDAPDVGRPAGEERGEGAADAEAAGNRPPERAVAVLAAALLGAAFLAAVAAGVLETVGPYLLGVAALGLALIGVVLARRRYRRSQ